jgi:hypothetical protein
MALPVQANQLSAQTLTRRVDTTTIGVVYVGEAAIGSAENAAVWRIKRVSVVDVATATLWANNGCFDQAWEDRAALIYN